MNKTKPPVLRSETPTRTYPTNTANQNVPRDTFLVAENVYMSGEITKTYYIDKGGNMWQICDWTISKPQPVSLSVLCRLTLDTERQISAKAESWYRNGCKWS